MSSLSLNIFAPQRKYKKTEQDPLDTSKCTVESNTESTKSDREADQSNPVLSELKTGAEDASKAIINIFSKTGEKLKEATSLPKRKITHGSSHNENESGSERALDPKHKIQEEDKTTTNEENKSKHAHFRDDYVIVEESKQDSSSVVATTEKVEPKEAGPFSYGVKRTERTMDATAVELLDMPLTPSSSMLFAVTGVVFCMAASSYLGVTYQSPLYNWITIVLFLVVAYFFGQSRTLAVANVNINLLLRQNRKILDRVTTLEKELNEVKDSAESESARARASARTDFLRSHASMVAKLTTRGVPEVDTDKDMLLPEGFSSSLQNPFGDEPPEICDFLSKRLLKIENLSRDPKNNQKVVPLCTLRGLDFLLTDSPEEPIYKNRYLNRVGLRDKPMLVFNALMPWANITLYYELPEWVKNFEEIEEFDSDAPDVKSFKRFLKNDDDYRTNRLQFLPCLVEGPAAIRMVAPPKKELIGRAILLPDVHWFKENEYIDKMGKKHCAVLEATTDVSGSSLTRSLAKIFRRSIGSIKADIAWVIDKPEMQKEDEPKCCIGFFQLDKVDVTKAPILPSPTEEENLYHASVVASMMGQ